MKKSPIFFLLMCIPLSLFSQNTIDDNKDVITYSKATSVSYPTSFYVSKPVRDMPVCDNLTTFDGYLVPKDGVNTSDEMSPKRKRKLAYLNSAGRSSTQIDPLLVGSENYTRSTANRAPIVNFESIGLDASPPDPSMAVGPNHIVTMENGLWAVYDKLGNIAAGFPKLLNDPLSGPTHMDNAGDPVVMYDREADRWFLSQFQLSGNASQSDDVFLIGVSTSGDPTGTYAVYEYELTHGNDYPHYGVWGDSYVTAGNFDDPQKIYTFNRVMMIAGLAAPEIVGFVPSGLGVGGFAAPIPVHSEAAGVATGDIKVVYYQDDAFAGISTDHIGLWNIDMDWTNATTIANSTISGKIQIPTAAFDAAIAGGFSNLQQPNTSVRIDAIVGAVMNMSHWYKFPTHESILLNWVVEIEDGTRKSGIRWVELRSTDAGTNWSVYQEGTYSDPAGATTAAKESVFMGCISMDKQGNIGLGYTKTGTSTFPSLYYTGRMDGDPLGTMTVAEELAIAGDASVTNNDRYGDYGQGVRDPVDDLTFWVTSEFSGSANRRVRVYSFKLGTDTDDDVGVTAIVQPSDGSGLGSNETVEVTLQNFGLNSQTNIPLNFSIDGNLIGTETFAGPLASGATANFTFTSNFADLSTVGQTYSVEACTALVGDEDNTNDCTTKSVDNLLGSDLGVIAITQPQSGIGLTTTETITITVENFGSISQSSIPVEYTINGGTAIAGTIPGPIAGGATGSFSFTTAADMSVVGGYDICAKTILAGDQEAANDELCQNITHISCTGTTTTTGGDSGCNLDGIKRFILGTIDADNGGNGCNTEPASGPKGYANRTNLSTDLDRVSGSNTHILQAQTNFNPETFIVWIDFNDNGVFENTEELINQAFTIEDALESFNLVIPTNAALGSHVLRCKGFDPNTGSVDPGPCGDVAYGEIQDYTVNIIDSSPPCSGVTKTWDGTNWSPIGDPDSTNPVILTGDYDTVIDGDLNGCSLIVDDGVTLTIPGNSFALIQGDITVNSMASLLIAHQGSLVQVDDDSSVTNNGTINVSLTTPSLASRDYMVLGSPMSDETDDIWKQGGTGAFLVLNHTTSNFCPNEEVATALPLAENFADDNYDNWTSFTGSVSPGEGYIVRPQAGYGQPGGIFSYTYNDGTLNNGVVPFAVGFNTSCPMTDNKNASPNVVANPYPSAISAVAFINANASVSEVYFWEHLTPPSPGIPGAGSMNFSMQDISMFNLSGGNAAAADTDPLEPTEPNGVIATGQGFGFKANSATGVVFNNSMRLTSGNSTLRTPESIERLRLSIKSNVYELQNTTLLAFTDGASDQEDSGYDSRRLANVLGLYSHLDQGEEEYGIQSRGVFNSAMEIPMGFTSQIAKSTGYKISISDREGGNLEQTPVYLVDHLLGITHDFSNGPYAFESDAGTFSRRFTLKFENEADLGVGDKDLSVISIFPNPTSDIIHIVSPRTPVNKVLVYDVRGRSVISKSFSTNGSYTLDMSILESALYFVEILTDNGSITKRILKQ